MTARVTGAHGEGRMAGSGGMSLRTLWWTAPEQKDAAVVVHGLGEHAARYEHVASALNASGIGVFSYDQRGHGLSAGNRGHAESFEVLLEDLDRAWREAEQVLGRAPSFLVGHSLGGLVSLAWTASRAPGLKGLVASAPWLATAARVPWWKVTMGRIAGRVLPRIPMDTGGGPEMYTRDPEMIAAWAADPLVHTTITPRLYTEVERWQQWVLHSGDRLKIPTLFFVPGADSVADASATLRLATAMPRDRTTIVELPGFLHEPFNDTGRAEVIARLCSWLVERMA